MQVPDRTGCGKVYREFEKWCSEKDRAGGNDQDGDLMNDTERLFALSAGERFHAIDGANVVQIEYCMGVVRANECDCEECNCECHKEDNDEEVQGVPV